MLKFTNPQKMILNYQNLELFLNSKIYASYIDFLIQTSESVKGKKVSDTQNISNFLQKLINILEQIESWLKDYPPLYQPMRYGNKAFRNFISYFKTQLPDLMDQLFDNLLPPEGKREISAYFIESFGNTIRIDYGTGHETNFMAFLFCLNILGFINSSDYSTVILKVFNRYIELMRKIQRQYMLEPAGSHGVWSLDDYSFLPFYFGSAQLYGNGTLSLTSVLDKGNREAYKDDYMYFSAIYFIYQMKSGCFMEHSPILYSMTKCKSWNKINTGLLKMYEAEITRKLPIMQHFLFGSIIPWMTNTE